MKPLEGMELFVEVARAKNFSRAADALGMPKSTLSRQVAALERSIGLRLLNRTTRKVELTDAGQLYFERCQRIVAEALIAHEELQHLVETPSGPLRVNMPADFGTDFMAESFVAFARRYPQVTFYLDQASPEHAGQVFQSCDVAIEIGELADSGKIARKLGVIPAYLYAAPTYLAERGEPAHPGLLAQHECLEFRAYGRNRPTVWPLHRGAEHLEIMPGKRFSLNSVAMVRRLATLGAGIAILAPVGGTQDDVQAGRLQRILPDWQAGPFTVHAVTDTRLVPAKTRIFIEFLIERLGGGGQHGTGLLN